MLLDVTELKVLHIGSFSLQLDAGETLFIRGESGSGKSLLLRAIADIDPAEGRVLLDGTDRNYIPPPQWRKQVALLPATPQWWMETVGEHFSKNCSELIQQLELRENILKEPIDRLSSGENQRLALIRVLQLRPKILLLDEPTANLDETNTKRVENALRAFQKQEQYQTGILWVSHDIAQSERMADHIKQLRDRKLHDIT